jgi:PleD family two-component response regulator
MKITISVGGSFCEEGELIDFNKFFQQADSSLYNAKNHGKNKSCLDGEMIKPTNNKKNTKLKNA